MSRGFSFLYREFISSMLHFDLELEVFIPRLVISLGPRLKRRVMPFLRFEKTGLYCAIKKKIEEVL